MRKDAFASHSIVDQKSPPALRCSRAVAAHAAPFSGLSPELSRSPPSPSLFAFGPPEQPAEKAEPGLAQQEPKPALVPFARSPCPLRRPLPQWCQPHPLPATALPTDWMAGGRRRQRVEEIFWVDRGWTQTKPALGSLQSTRPLTSPRRPAAARTLMRAPQPYQPGSNPIPNPTQTHRLPKHAHPGLAPRGRRRPRLRQRLRARPARAGM